MTTVKLYLPRADACYPEARDACKRLAADVAGGFTTYRGRGGWVNGDGEIAGEPVTVVETITEGGGEELAHRLARLAYRMMDQTEVLAVADGEKIVVADA